MQTIENSSLESLKAQNATQLTETDDIKQTETEEDGNNECKGLTEEKKQQSRMKQVGVMR
ncbi:MAG: hypothetical protein ACOX2W_08435 [Desulfomonilia bacterium]